MLYHMNDNNIVTFLSSPASLTHSLTYSPPHSLIPSLPPTFPLRIKDILAAQAAAPTVKAGPLGRFSDLLGLYQALSLVAPMQPDLEIDPELQVEF